MERQEMLKWKKAAWQKLMGAIAMLLVASIMMSATSYAWFVLSTAPEVTDLTTTAGANGALEIALQSNKADGTGRADILSGVGQSIASKDARTANTYWGNVVDLSKGYGLEHITLYPARLNLNGGVVSTTSMLSIPTFGTDGRVTSLKNAEKTYYKDGKFEQGQSHWGVNVMGATSDRAGTEETITLTYNRDFVLNEARTKVAEYRTSLREQMTGAIENNAMGIMGILIRLAAQELGDDFTYPIPEDQTIETLTNYIAVMKNVITDAGFALKWALLANVAADEVHFPSNDEEAMTRLGWLYANYAELPLVVSGENAGGDSVKSIAEQYGYTAIANSAEEIDTASKNLETAEGLVTTNPGVAGLKLVSYTQTFMYGSNTDNDKVEGVQAAAAYDFGDEGRNEDTIFTVAGNTASDTNLFSSMAELIGDYFGNLGIWLRLEFSTPDGDPLTGRWIRTWVDAQPTDQSDTVKAVPFKFQIRATNCKNWNEWNEDNNVGVLGELLNKINDIIAPGTIQVQLTRSDLSAYGYSVDLALKCSKDTDLQLQQEGIVRVSSDGSGTEDVAADTMGGGSTMVFDLAGDLTEAQVRKLMQGIYVVLLNTDTGAIYKIAAVDPDQLTVDQLQYPNRATGTLTLYEPVIQDGVLSLGAEAASITAMTADTQLNLTALVFLNGDQVDASMFSGTQPLSLTGTLNLQFASSEALTAMDYTDYAPEKTDNP